MWYVVQRGEPGVDCVQNVLEPEPAGTVQSRKDEETINKADVFHPSSGAQEVHSENIFKVLTARVVVTEAMAVLHEKTVVLFLLLKWRLRSRCTVFP